MPCVLAKITTAHLLYTRAQSGSKSIMAPRIVALIGGGQAAGKKSVCEAIIKRLREWKVLDVKQLSFEDFKNSEIGQDVNPESPDAYDFISALKAIELCTNDVLLVEGMYTLYDATMKDLGAIRIYIDVDADLRLSRRITRDTNNRGLSLQEVLDNYLTNGKPAMERYVQPTKVTADAILMRGTEPSGIELIAGAIYDRLLELSTGNTSADSTPAWQSSHGKAIRRTLLGSDLEVSNESFYEVA
ncbi:uridine kinase family-domain-containing protein [Lipomyces arxii]|uniref:uridine kinase family-domain-containing protein n=1 Tax=Lipomyces arxii TaxID=56418 RepID=UPI0034CE7C0A